MKCDSSYGLTIGHQSDSTNDMNRKVNMTLLNISNFILLKNIFTPRCLSIKLKLSIRAYQKSFYRYDAIQRKSTIWIMNIIFLMVTNKNHNEAESI